MLFKSTGKRLVYRVTSTDEGGDTRLIAFFHDPGKAQAHAAAQMLNPRVWGIKIEVVVMEFDGWKVVG